MSALSVLVLRVRVAVLVAVLGLIVWVAVRVVVTGIAIIRVVVTGITIIRRIGVVWVAIIIWPAP